MPPPRAVRSFTLRLAPAVILLAGAAAAQEETAFVDVTVAPMAGAGLLPAHTVVVRDGLIVAVGPAGATAPPEGARRIDGKGRFLLPGLADMHAHVWYEEELFLNLAKGVTTVRNMWGTEQHAAWAQEIREGARLGPTLYTTGNLLDGRPPVWGGSTVVTTPEEARAAVREQAKKGGRAVKVYNNLRPEVYEALVDAARAWDLRVEGHVPYAVGVERVLELRQDSIEHLDGYVRWFAPFDKERMERLVARTVEARTWNCPTLVVWTKFVPQEDAARMAARPEMRYVPPRLRATWRPDEDFRLKDMTPARWEALRATQATRRTLVRMLRDAGAPLLLGTDAGNPFVVAGWAAHEELAELVAAGLTPYEALRAATADAARYLGAPSGTIEPGRRADLLLLEADPFEDVANAARCAGVMVRGRWLPADEIRRGLESIAESYGKPKRRLEGLPGLLGGTEYRYEVRWNDLVVAEGRFTLEHGAGDGGAAGEVDTTVLRIQRVDDAPWPAQWTTQISADAEGRVLRIDQTKVAPGGTRVFQLVRTGHRVWLAERDDARCVSEEDTTLGPGEDLSLNVFPFWAIAQRRFARLAVGEALDLETRDIRFGEGPALVRSPLRVERRADENGLRVYVVHATDQGQPVRIQLATDAEGLPVRASMGLQLGTVRFARVP